jgi:hypothetical protein
MSLHHESAQAATAISRDRFANTDITVQEALATARERFPNLSSNGILGRKFTGPPICLTDIDKALTFLRGCRRTIKPNIHSVDLACDIGVSIGAVIAAATALNFTVQSWMFVPNAMIGVNKFDLRQAVATRRR